MKKKISGSVTDRNLFTKSFKKQQKYWKKEIKKYHMETDKFYKLAPQALKNSDLNIISKKMEDSYDSDSDSHSESDTNVKQAI